jgi:hypothetical protein
MDNAAYETLVQLNLPEIHPISIEEFEENDESLLSAKKTRSRIEYYFTCSPSLPLYILENWPEVDLVTYIDADLFFFSNPAPLFEELGEESIAIIGHRFPPHLRHMEEAGIYNVGWLSFRRDKSGLTCLRWWRERCIEWCYDRIEDDRFADQKYLDDWPSRFQNVVVLEHKGANLASWNLANYSLSCVNGNIVMVDNQPLIFFHFHSLKRINKWLYDPGWRRYAITPSKLLRQKIYAPYIQTLFEESQLLPVSQQPVISKGIRNSAPTTQVSKIRSLARRLWVTANMFRDMVTGRYILVLLKIPKKKTT